MRAKKLERLRRGFRGIDPRRAELLEIDIKKFNVAANVAADVSHNPWAQEIGYQAGINPDANPIEWRHSAMNGIKGRLRLKDTAVMQAACWAIKQAFDVEREKTSTGSQSESGFIPEGAIGKTVGLSYRTEANL